MPGVFYDNDVLVGISWGDCICYLNKDTLSCPPNWDSDGKRCRPGEGNCAADSDFCMFPNPNDGPYGSGSIRHVDPWKNVCYANHDFPTAFAD